MIRASTKRKNLINRGLSSDSYILLESELNIIYCLITDSLVYLSTCGVVSITKSEHPSLKQIYDIQYYH